MSMIKYDAQLDTPNDALYLRCTRPDDALALHSLVVDPANNPYLARFEPWAQDFTLAEAQAQTARVSQRMRQGDCAIMQYMAMRRTKGGEPDRMIGCDTLFNHVGDSAILGYWQAFAECGNGFATQGARRLIEHAQEVWGLKEVLLRIADDNTPSQAVARRLGAKITDKVVRVETRGQTYDKRLWAKALI